ncbi:MAG: IPT/TIG domain-containing protein [Solirubrobacteraceae bacterium]
MSGSRHGADGGAGTAPETPGQSRARPKVLRRCATVAALSLLATLATLLSSLPALASGGEPFSWGVNANGELGNGTTENHEGPIHVLELSEVTQMAAGEFHSLALTSAGTVMAWGANGKGQLGDGTTTQRTLPVPVGGLSEVTSLAAGGSDSYVLLSDGSVMAWGNNAKGQLGDGGTEGSSVPVEVSGISEATSVAASGTHALALLKDGTVVAWGGNEHGDLGDGTTEQRDAPIAVAGLSEVVAVTAGEHFGAALLADGEVRTWGSGEDGELGNGGTEDSSSPVAVSGLIGVTAISAGQHHVLALTGEGTVEAWGEDKWGQLGNGALTNSSLPVEVDELTGATAVAAGGLHSFALLADGELKAWGGDERGQLGTGYTTTHEDKPVPVGCGLQGITGIATGFNTGLAWGEANELCPELTSLSPDEGVAEGGNTISILGSGFGGATEVKFGSKASPSFEVQPGGDEIKAVVPAGSETVFVTVKTPRGTAENEHAPYTYRGVPSVTGLSPSFGEAGQEIGIDGRNLGNVTEVDVDGSSVPFFIGVGGGAVYVKHMPSGSGVVTITVTNPSGTSASGPADEFTYVQTPEFGRCVKGGNSSGRFEDKGCTFEPPEEAEHATPYNWEPAFGRNGLAEKGFTLAGEATTLETAELKITCTGAHASGEYTSGQTVSTGSLVLAGCKVIKGPGKGASCQSSGDATGDVSTGPLTGRLGEQIIKTLKAGIELAPSSGETFAEFSCGATTVAVTGAVIIEVPSDKMASTASWKATEKKGVQAFGSFKGGPEVKLDASIDGFTAEPIGLKAKITQTSEEAVEVNTAY